MLKEFKNFIMTGNVIEFAVAVIMAGAVGLVVNGFVNDIVMPLVGHFTGGVDFANLKIIYFFWKRNIQSRIVYRRYTHRTNGIRQ